MAPTDLWYLKKRGPGGERLPSKRHGRGKRWRVTYDDPNTGREITEHFDKKTQAETFENNIKADISRGQYIDLDAGKVTVKEYAEAWRAQQVHQLSTAERVERAFRLHVYPVLGGKPMGAVRASDIRAWKKDRLQILAPSSVGVVFVDLKAMFTDAVDDRVLGHNPCSSVKPPEVDSKDRFIPSAAQVHDLAAAMLSHYRPIPYIAAGCGLRPSEIYGLELEHVDFLRREVHIEQQLSRGKGVGIHIGRVKSKSSRRTVELPQTVADELAQHIARHPPTVVELDDRRDPRKVVRREAKMLFTTSEGGPVTRSLWSRPWRTALKKVDGMPEGFGLHGLRHYFATLLIHAGASVKTVQLALGHATPTTTLNTYIHDWPEATDRTRNIVDDALKATEVADEAAGDG